MIRSEQFLSPAPAESGEHRQNGKRYTITLPVEQDVGFLPGDSLPQPSLPRDRTESNGSCLSHPYAGLLKSQTSRDTYRTKNVSFSWFDDDCSAKSNSNLYTGSTKLALRKRSVFSIDVGSGWSFCGPKRDILRSCENEVNDYLKELEDRQNEMTYLRTELHAAARNNEFYKMRTLCNFLISNGHSLVEDDLLGTRYGESALIVAIVKGSTESAIVLIDFGGDELIHKHYSTKQFAEVLPLHVAIIKQNATVVEYMLSALDDDARLKMINSRARSRDIRDVCICPWIPMALAISVGSIPIVELLLRTGADLRIRVSDTGNTVLHVLADVAVSAPDVAKRTLYRLLNNAEAKRWWRENGPPSGELFASAFLRMRNKAELTPLAYAVSRGATEFAAAILDLDQVYTYPQWYLGPKKACLYEVSEIDPAARRKANGVPSILEMYAYSKSDRALAFGKTPHLHHVMENKFAAYKYWFVAFFVFHLLVITCFTVVCAHFDVPPVFASFLRKNANASSSSWTDDDIPNWKKYTIQSLELFVLLSASTHIILELVDVFSLFVTNVVRAKSRQYSLRKYLSLWQPTLCDSLSVVLFVFSSSVVAVFVLRLLDSPYQDLISSLALVAGWSFMLFFIRALKNIGIFTAILHRIIVRDLSHFLVLFLIGTMASGTGMYTLFNKPGEAKPPDVRSLPQTCFTLFKVLVGLDEFDVVENVGKPWAAKLIFVVFVLFCHILLLNMLIAAMNNRYIRLTDMKKVLWLQARTKAVLFLERRLARCLRPDHGFERLDKDNDDLLVLAREEADSEHPLTNFGFDDDVLSTT